jgi:hypothetical protein
MRRSRGEEDHFEYVPGQKGVKLTVGWPGRMCINTATPIRIRGKAHRAGGGRSGSARKPTGRTAGRLPEPESGYSGSHTRWRGGELGNLWREASRGEGPGRDSGVESSEVN